MRYLQNISIMLFLCYLLTGCDKQSAIPNKPDNTSEQNFTNQTKEVAKTDENYFLQASPSIPGDLLLKMEESDIKGKIEQKEINQNDFLFLLHKGKIGEEALALAKKQGYSCVSRQQFSSITLRDAKQKKIIKELKAQKKAEEQESSFSSPYSPISNVSSDVSSEETSATTEGKPLPIGSKFTIQDDTKKEEVKSSSSFVQWLCVVISIFAFAFYWKKE